MLERALLAPLSVALLVIALVLVAIAVVVGFRRLRSPGRPERAVVVDDAQAGAAVTRLPPDVTDFVGRTAELARLRELRPAEGDEASPVVCVLAGRPGVGKTALAVRMAHDLRPAFGDGVLYLNLQGSRQERLTTEDALSCLLRAVGAGGRLGPTGLEAQAARLRGLLTGKRILLVLDDAADAEHVRALLPDAPGCLTVITSRQPLDDLSVTTTLDLQPLSAPDAVALLSAITGGRRVSRDPVAAATVARSCEYLPLALRIAGARMRVRPGAPPLVAIADHLIHERLRLDDRKKPEPGIWAGASLSYSVLTQGEATLFRRLALLPGPDFGVPIGAALAIAAPAEAERGLDRLAAAQLLERAGPGRYRFHDVVRQFALERMDVDETTSARRAARRRVLSAYLSEAKATAEVIGSLRPGTEDYPRPRLASRLQQTAALAWFERERLNLAAAVRLAADTAEPHFAWRLAACLATFLDVRDYSREWIEVAETALHAARDSRDPYAVAVVLHDLGDARRQQGHTATAAAFLTESLKGFSALDSPEDEARVLVTLGRLHQENRKLVAAVDFYRRALAIFRAYGLRRDEIEVFTTLGAVRRLQGRLEEAAVFLEEALALVRAGDSGRLLDDLTAAHAAENLGMVRLGQGRVTEAAAYHAESLATFEEIGARRARAYALRNLGECKRLQGAPTEAARHYEESLALLTVLDDRAGQGLVWSSRGQLHADAGRWDQAADAYHRAVTAFHEVGDRQQEGLALLSSGKALLHTAGAETAAKPLRLAEQILVEVRAVEVKEARLLLADIDWPEGPEDSDLSNGGPVGQP